jgi:hypothetical protein
VVKSWHLLLLAACILVGSGAIAAMLGLGNRYHYPAFPVKNSVSRIDNFTGAVEVYDMDRGWVHVRDK